MVTVNVCPECGREFGNAGGLASHMRARHGAASLQGANRRALEATLRELRQAERLEPVHAAAIQMLRSLADVLDAGKANAQMWRTYREALEDLVGTDDNDSDFAALLAEINSRAPVGYPPPPGT